MNDLALSSYPTDEMLDRIDGFTCLSLAMMAVGIVVSHDSMLKYHGQSELDVYGADVVVHSFHGVPQIIFIEDLPKLDGSLVGEVIDGKWRFLVMTKVQYENSRGLDDKQAGRFWNYVKKKQSPFNGDYLKDGIK